MEDPTPRLERFQSYEAALSDFRLRVPDHLNIALSIVARHPDAVTRIALLENMPGGTNTYTFGGLDYLSDKFANALAGCGIKQGDVVATISTRPGPVAITSLAALKLGAAPALIPASWGLDSIEHALTIAKARAVIAPRHICEATGSRAALENVEARFVIDTISGIEETGANRHFWRETYTAPSFFEPADTLASQPALITFVMRTGGELSIIAHSHAALIAQLPAFEMFCDLKPREISKLKVAQDWSEGAVFFGLVLPSWWYGVAVETRPGGRDTTSRVCLVPEAGLVAATCGPWFSERAGSAGKIAPGRLIEIVDELGKSLPRQSAGRLAVSAEDAARPLDFPATSNDAVTGRGALITDQAGFIDEQGYLRLLPNE